MQAGGGQPRGAVVVYSVAARTYEMLTDFGDSDYVAWLNDSRRLLFVHEGKLFLVDRESKRTREVASLPGEGIHGPVLSRDNRQLYFLRCTSESDIWMATLQPSRRPPPERAAAARRPLGDALRRARLRWTRRRLRS